MLARSHPHFNYRLRITVSKQFDKNIEMDMQVRDSGMLCYGKKPPTEINTPNERVKSELVFEKYDTSTY